MGERRGLVRLFFPVNFIALATAVVLTGWYLTATFSQVCREKAFSELTAQAGLLEKLVQGKFSEAFSKELDAVLKDVSSKTPVRLTVVLPSGKVIADSQEDPERTDDYRIRPEVRDALGGKSATLTRVSLTTNVKTFYAATPVVEQGRVAGVVRAALPVPNVVACAIEPLFSELAVAAGLVILLAVGLSFYVARRINRSISELRAAASRFAALDLGHRVSLVESQECGALADDLNTMAGKLEERISSIRGQRNELEAVLGGMVEAVILVDAGERVLRINKAAEGLFAIDEERVKNRTVQEVIRNTELHRFISATLGHEEPLEGDIVMIGDPDRFLQAHGKRIDDADGNIMGTLIVLNDVTRLKNLENMRRDFVANVSHELKTPITSIKGFLETLKDGALGDPENAQRFLEIVIRHTDRLNEIIEDLLSLSRIERDYERGEIVLEDELLNPVFESVVRNCTKKAQSKNIEIRCEITAPVSARINPTLLEQAVFNLVDNAIKYSEPGTPVVMEAFKEGGEVIIRVADKGCGIPKEHLARIFERFYRIDKGRSRKVGGTGLGLSIVKHIVNAHSGNIAVESSPGSGSTFTIRLPIPQSN